MLAVTKVSVNPAGEEIPVQGCGNQPRNTANIYAVGEHDWLYGPQVSSGWSDTNHQRTFFI